MDPHDKRVLSKSVLYLIDNIKASVRFKATLASSLILEDDELDEIIDQRDNEAVVYVLVQKLKLKGGVAFDGFLEVLDKCDQSGVADWLRNQRQDSGNYTASSLPSAIGQQHGRSSAADDDHDVTETPDDASPETGIDVTMPSAEGDHTGTLRSHVVEASGTAGQTDTIKGEDRTETAEREVTDDDSDSHCSSEISVGHAESDEELAEIPEPAKAPESEKPEHKPEDKQTEVSTTVANEQQKAGVTTKQTGVAPTVAGETEVKVTQQTTKNPDADDNVGGKVTDTGVKDEDDIVIPTRLFRLADLYLKGIPEFVMVNGQEMSLRDLRREVGSCLATDGPTDTIGNIVCNKDYMILVSDFTRNRTDEAPGPFEGLDLDAPVIFNDGVSAFSPECAAKLCRLLGGRSKLYLGLDHGSKVFCSIDTQVRFVLISLYEQPANRRVKGHGWWFNTALTLAEAVTSAAGFRPSRIRSPDGQGGHTDVDMTFRVVDWHQQVRNKHLDIWR